MEEQYWQILPRTKPETLGASDLQEVLDLRKDIEALRRELSALDRAYSCLNKYLAEKYEIKPTDSVDLATGAITRAAGDPVSDGVRDAGAEEGRDEAGEGPVADGSTEGDPEAS